MTENNKPEWFEIIDADEKPAPRKVSKTLPISAVLVTTLILGVGAVVAQTQSQTPASATSAGVQQTQSAVANPTAAVAAVVGGVAANKVANPSIANLPTGGGDDEDDDHGRGHDDEEGDDD
jgi:hypothetical protein